MHDLFDIRLMLEPQICRAASGRVDAERLRRTEALVTGRHDLDDRNSLETYVRANTLLHIGIAEYTGNQRLVQLMESILDEMERIMLLSYILGDRQDSTDPDHGPLIDALEANQPDLAEQIMHDQLMLNRTFVFDAFLSAPGVLQSVSIASVP
ncbi:MAG: FCD domain-containing protein [Thermomicrobiales bacterium]